MSAARLPRTGHGGPRSGPYSLKSNRPMAANCPAEPKEIV